MTETAETQAPPAEDWRADPRWKLVSWHTGYFTAQPSDVPLPTAELAQPPAWASLYDDHGALVATWSRL